MNVSRRPTQEQSDQEENERSLVLCRDEHEGYERDLPNHQKRLDHAGSRIDLLKYAPAPAAISHALHSRPAAVLHSLPGNIFKRCLTSNHDI